MAITLSLTFPCGMRAVLLHKAPENYRDTISYWDEHLGSLVVGFLCSGLDLITCANCIIQTQILATDRKLNDV